MTDSQPQQEPRTIKPQAMVTCPKCGRANSVGNRYCIICDARLPAPGSAPPTKQRTTNSGKKGGFFSKLFGRR
jgi:hypothetical protein